ADRFREYFVAVVLREATVSAAKENGCKLAPQAIRLTLVVDRKRRGELCRWRDGLPGLAPFFMCCGVSSTWSRRMRFMRWPSSRPAWCAAGFYRMRFIFFSSRWPAF